MLKRLIAALMVAFLFVLPGISMSEARPAWNAYLGMDVVGYGGDALCWGMAIWFTVGSFGGPAGWGAAAAGSAGCMVASWA